MRGSVLVVDDEPKIREVLRGYLQSEGFVVGRGRRRGERVGAAAVGPT